MIKQNITKETKSRYHILLMIAPSEIVIIYDQLNWLICILPNADTTTRAVSIYRYDVGIPHSRNLFVNRRVLNYNRKTTQYV